MYACLAGNLNLVRARLESGADIHYQEENKGTALHQAAHRGYTEIVAYLLRNGADPNICSKEGMTCLDCSSNTEIIELIEAAGGKLNHLRWNIREEHTPVEAARELDRTILSENLFRLFYSLKGPYCVSISSLQLAIEGMELLGLRRKPKLLMEFKRGLPFEIIEDFDSFSKQSFFEAACEAALESHESYIWDFDRKYKALEEPVAGQ